MNTETATAELPHPVAYVATDGRPPYLRIYGVGETRFGAREDARCRHGTGGLRVLRATARLVEAANSVGPGGNIWGVYQDHLGDFADLAGPDGERLPADQE